jgi:hypothetical protein
MKILDKIERWIAEDMLVSLAIAVNFGVLLMLITSAKGDTGSF